MEFHGIKIGLGLTIQVQQRCLNNTFSWCLLSQMVLFLLFKIPRMGQASFYKSFGHKALSSLRTFPCSISNTVLPIPQMTYVGTSQRCEPLKRRNSQRYTFLLILAFLSFRATSRTPWKDETMSLKTSLWGHLWDGGRTDGGIFVGSW